MKWGLISVGSKGEIVDTVESPADKLSEFMSYNWAEVNRLKKRIEVLERQVRELSKLDEHIEQLLLLAGLVERIGSVVSDLVTIHGETLYYDLTLDGQKQYEADRATHNSPSDVSSIVWKRI